MPAYSDRTARLIDQTGIETFFGATPVQLPKLNRGQQQTRRAGGLTALQHAGVVNVGADLLRRDPSLAQTAQILSAPEAVVRVDRHGTESTPAQFWVFVQNGRIVQLAVDAKADGQYRLAALADSTALFAAIQELLPLAWMPHKAFARAVLGQGDAQDVYDQAQGTGFNVAAELLESDGLTEEDARVAFDVMRTCGLGGRISFMRMHGDKLELTYGLAVGQDGDDIWMAFISPQQSVELVLETVLKGAFHRQLEEGWTSLKIT